jgi:hypothetical protein
MTQDQTNGRAPAPSFTPISATKVDNPKQTEFRLVSPAPAETEPDSSPTTPVPAVPSQSRRDAPVSAADSATDDGATDNSATDNSATDTAPNRVVDDAADDSAADDSAADDSAADDSAADDSAADDSAADDSAVSRHGRLAEGEELMPGAEDDEPLPFSAGAGETPADARADEELLAAGAAGGQRPARDGLDDEPLLAGVEELRAGWQRVRIAFVDNPRGAVAEAAGLTDEAAEALAAALRERRHRIRASWDANGSGRDTEALRLALLRYQALFSQIVGGLAHGARVRRFHFR